MRVLLTNDDGISSPGLIAVLQALAEVAETVVIAPAQNQSAVARSITLRRDITVTEHDLAGAAAAFAVDGTPVDCVRFAALGLGGGGFDAVVSGANLGHNLGDDVTYSGTISAAFEGALLDIPSIAFSALVGEHFSFDRCAEFAGELTRIALTEHRDPRVILNVNFPVREFNGVKITTLGRRIYSEGVIERKDPRGRSYFWIGGEPPVWHAGSGTDFGAVHDGYVSITPLHLDLTHHESIPRLKPLEETLGHFAAKR